MPKKPYASRPLTPEQLIVKRQYFVTRDYKNKELGKLKEDSIVLLPRETALPLVASKTLVILQLALKQGLYPPKPKPKLVEKIKTATKRKRGRPRKYLGNKLRDKVQAKKRAKKTQLSKAEQNQITKLKAIKKLTKKA